MRDFGPDLFAGTAAYYAKYRAKYPPEFFQDVIKFFNLNGHGRMLDLGCGTGELAIPLANYFDNVLAIDPEPEMLKQARHNAKKSDITNVEWKIGSSRNLVDIDGQFKLIGLGQSFHWMDTKIVIDQLYNLLNRGGGLCLIGSEGQSALYEDKTITDKEAVIKNLITAYLGPKRRAGNGFYSLADENWEQDLFPNSKFGNFKKQVYITKVVRNVDQELGNLYSMSWARRDYFGKKIDKFESEFREKLLAISNSGKFENRVRYEAYFFTKK